MLITMQDYLKGREKKFASEFTDDLYRDALKTVAMASQLLSFFGEKRYITSGWRPKQINAAVGGAPSSQHIYCRAIDIEDKPKTLGKWCTENIEHLIELGLYMESLETTHVKAEEEGKVPWIHLQTISPRSGNRIFIP